VAHHLAFLVLCAALHRAVLCGAEALSAAGPSGPSSRPGALLVLRRGAASVWARAIFGAPTRASSSTPSWSASLAGGPLLSPAAAACRRPPVYFAPAASVDLDAMDGCP
jgi:hypothetical protein